MNFKKFFAGASATAVAVSAFSVAAFADVTVAEGVSYLDAAGGLEIYNAESGVDIQADLGIAFTDIYGFTYNTTPVETEMADDATWVGGGVGFNSESTGWSSTEWGKESGAKPIVYDESGVITLLQDAPVFAETDTYVQIWIQTWGGSVQVNSLDILGADGTVIATCGAAVADEEEVVADEEEVAADEEEVAADEEEAVEDEEEVAETEETEAEPEETEAPAETEAPVDTEAVAETTAAAGDTDTATTDKATNPSTGVALVLVPAAIAAAGVVIAKKRK